MTDMNDSKFYMFAVKIDTCNVDKYCIYKVTSGCKLKTPNQSLTCHLPIYNNPVCLCNNVRNCKGNFRVVEYKDEKYIVYYCKRGKCQHLVEKYQLVIDKILSKDKKKRLITGDKLTKILESSNSSRNNNEINMNAYHSLGILSDDIKAGIITPLCSQQTIHVRRIL